MKEQQNNHPTVKLIYQNMPFTILHPQGDRIIIKFQDFLNHYSYSTQKQLKYINYKTLIAALQNSEPQFIRSILFPLEDHKYELRIKVQLQFISQIEQVFNFEGIKMADDKIKQINSINVLQKKVVSLKDELLSLSKSYLINGKVKKREKKNNEIIINIPFQLTVFSINLSFKKLVSNIIKVGFYYYDSNTKAIVSQNMLPDSFYYDGSSDIVVVGDKTKFNQTLITLDGEFQEAAYSIKVQQAKQSMPLNKRKIALTLIVFGLFAVIFYIFSQQQIKQKSVQL